MWHIVRTQLATAKRIVSRNKNINQETNRELTEVLQEVLLLRERNKTLESTLEVFKVQAEANAKTMASPTSTKGGKRAGTLF